MVSTSDRHLGAESDLRFVSSLPLEGPLNDDAFKTVAIFELPAKLLRIRLLVTSRSSNTSVNWIFAS